MPKTKIASAVFILLQLVCNSLFSQIPVNGLIAYYPFDGNCKDLSGNGLNAINLGALLTADRCGFMNSAYYFNGSAYLNALDINNLDSAQALSLAAWIYTDGITDLHHGTIVAKFNADGDSGRVFIFDVYPNGTTRFAVYGEDGNGDYVTQVSTSSILFSQWNHVAVTWNGPTHTIDLYINGVKVPSYGYTLGSNPTTMIYNKSSPLTIGAVYYAFVSPDYFFSGAIDEVLIYKRVLTSQEIWNLYNNKCQPLTILGTNTVCAGQQNVPFQVQTELQPNNYKWSYDGSGVSIVGDSSLVYVNFSDHATSGNLNVIVSGDSIQSHEVNFPISVTSLPAPSGPITGDSHICVNQNEFSYTVSSILNADSYLWTYSGSGANFIGKDNFEKIVFSPNATSGTLYVSGKNNCGVGLSSPAFSIQLDSLPAGAGQIMGDTSVCTGSDGYIYSVPIINNTDNYQWIYTGSGVSIINNSTSASLSFSANATSGKLLVSGVNYCGVGQSSPQLMIDVQSCESFHVPNTFTPNGDNINDLFEITNLPQNSKLTIFDRNGHMVYESDNYQNNWDGKDSRGKILETNTYWYVLIMPGILTPLTGYVYLKK